MANKLATEYIADMRAKLLKLYSIDFDPMPPIRAVLLEVIADAQRDAIKEAHERDQLTAGEIYDLLDQTADKFCDFAGLQRGHQLERK